jgi:hypothetical protein
MTVLEKVIKENIDEVKEFIVRNKCPYDFGLQNNYKFCISDHCEKCWHQEVEDSK